MEHPYGKQYGQEGNPRAYMTMRDYRNLPYQWQQPVERNPSEYRSMREYRDQWMSAPVYSVPSTYPPPPQYDHPEPPFYASTPQSPLSQQPPPLSPLVEQAILNLSKKVDNFIEESSLVKELDGFQSRIDKKLDILQESISTLTNQFVHQEEENLEEECLTETILVEQAQLQPQEELKVELVEAPEELQDASVTFWPWKKEEQTSALISEEEIQEEECLSGTMVEEQCEQQPHQELIEDFIELSEGLTESSDMCDVVFPRENQEQISALITEESSGHETGEEPQEPILQPIPMKLNPSATAQPQNNPLLVAPSTDQVYILPSPVPQPTPATKSTPAAPAPKAKSNQLPAVPPDSVFILPMPAAQPKPQASTTKATPSLLVLQNIRRLVASVHAFATTSKTMATAYIAWHSGWFGCGFGFGTLGPRHF